MNVAKWKKPNWTIVYEKVGSENLNSVDLVLNTVYLEHQRSVWRNYHHNTLDNR